MIKILFSFLCFAFPLINLAQTHFENGYFIDNNGNKTEVLVKNVDWGNNPQFFEYKLSIDSEVKTLTLQDTDEVVIAGKIKYTRHLVEVEQSQSLDLSYLSRSRQPEFSVETVFLKSLVEGTASLFLYKKGNSVRYFYRLGENKVAPLVYKKYLTTNDKIGENNEYKQTLFNNLKCDAITLNNVERLSYDDKSLVNFFVKYNECTGTDFFNYKENQTKFLFNLNARVGVNFTSFEMSNNTTDRYDIDYGSQTSMQFGIEAEFVLPFNNHKWAVIIEPTYQYYKAEKVLDLSQVFENKKDTEINYRSIDVPLGVRHYFFLNDTSKLFVNGSFVMAFDMDSRILRESLRPIRVGSIGSNMAFGLGFNYKNRFSAEVRYSTKRNILSNSLTWVSDYHSTALILGYRFF